MNNKHSFHIVISFHNNSSTNLHKTLDSCVIYRKHFRSINVINTTNITIPNINNVNIINLKVVNKSNQNLIDEIFTLLKSKNIFKILFLIEGEILHLNKEVLWDKQKDNILVNLHNKSNNIQKGLRILNIRHNWINDTKSKFYPRIKLGETTIYPSSNSIFITNSKIKLFKSDFKKSLNLSIHYLKNNEIRLANYNFKKTLSLSLNNEEKSICY